MNITLKIQGYCSGVAIAALLLWSPLVTAGDYSHPPKPSNTNLIIENAIQSGPETFSVKNYRSSSGEKMLDMDIGNGKSFTYRDGESIIIFDGAKSIDIAIVGEQVHVGKYECSSIDTLCIVHSVRKQLKKLSQLDAANGLAIIQKSIGRMAHGDTIRNVFYNLAALPVTKDDIDDDDKDKASHQRR
mgnify:CR=1 FL=1